MTEPSKWLCEPGIPLGTDFPAEYQNVPPAPPPLTDADRLPQTIEIIRRSNGPFSKAVCLRLVDELTAVTAERDRLKAAIVDHHAQHADDRCWMDDAKLYEDAGLEKHDATIGDPEAMLANCRRYIKQRCLAGGSWQSYQQLEERCRLLERLVDSMDRLCDCATFDADDPHLAEIGELKQKLSI